MPRRVAVRPVGFFAELNLHQAKGRPLLRDVVQDTPVADEGRIVAYLRAGRPTWVSRGRGHDVLRPEWIPIPDEHGLLRTDGVWTWPSELAYYVEQYHVRLPAEFVELMRVRDFLVPDLPADVSYEYDPRDTRRPE